jgi:hypothetical protein
VELVAQGNFVSGIATDRSCTVCDGLQLPGSSPLYDVDTLSKPCSADARTRSLNLGTGVNVQF